MSTWKVILATLVIFIAGLFTGAVSVNRIPRAKPFLPRPPQEFTAGPPVIGRELLPRMERQLDLTRTQRERIEKIFRDSRERTTILWKLLDPEWREELRYVTAQIREELGPEQRARFEELLKRPRRPEEMSVSERRRLRPPSNGPSAQPDRLK